MREAAIKRFGRLDIIINNAAISSGHPIAEADEARSPKFWRVNVMGVQMGIEEAAAWMRPGSAIVNISSITAVLGFAQWVNMAQPKARSFP